MVAPGVWRNICPLATSNQTPRLLGITKGLNPPAWLKEYGYVIAVSGFFGFIILRKVGLDDSGPLSALLLLGAMAGAFAGGMVLKGKSGWCSTDLPAAAGAADLRPDAVRARRQQPLPAVRRLREVLLRLQPARRLPGRPQRHRRLLERLPQVLHRRLPGPRPGFLRDRPRAPSRSSLLYVAVSTALFALAITFVKVSTHTITSTFGAIAFSIFYFEAAASWQPATWPVRAAAIALAGVWLLAHLAEGEAVPGPGRGPRRRRGGRAARPAGRSPTTAR